MLSERELESRYEVFLEQYVTKLNIEAETAASIARTMLLPAAARHLAMLLERPADRARRRGVRGLTSTEFVEAIKRARGGEPRPRTSRTTTGLEHAEYMRDTVIPAMAAVREAADKLEKVVADDLWPLPKYAEILFIK